MIHNQKVIHLDMQIAITRFSDNAETQLALFKLADDASYTAKMHSLQYRLWDDFSKVLNNHLLLN
jgi:protein tyrosine phosphatase